MTTDQIATPAPPATPEFPSLRGRHVYLRSLAPGDYGPLQQLETNGEVGHPMALSRLHAKPRSVEPGLVARGVGAVCRGPCRG
jgi:hypothetical protein